MIRPIRRGILCALCLAALPAVAFAQVGRGALLDPNVATADTLKKATALGEQAIAALIAKRPFASIVELDTLLGAEGVSREQRTAAYRQMFIHVNLNAASNAELLLIPGVGRRMAHEFEEYRPYDGGLPEFRREIGKYVDGKEVARLEQYVFVPIDLNTASDEQILSIPGVGRRMLREFKEYRPYRSLERFRKEIGKYVDAREVARLERYVTITPAGGK